MIICVIEVIIMNARLGGGEWAARGIGVGGGSGMGVCESVWAGVKGVCQCGRD